MTKSLKRRGVRTMAIVFLALACIGAAFLLYVSLKNGPIAGCGKGSSCDAVLSSRWAYLLPGVPVTAPALFTYLVLLFGLIFKPDSKSWVGVLLVGSLMVIGAAVWFFGLQAFVVKAFCKYCLATHAAGVAGSVCVILSLRPIARELLPLGVGAAAMGLAMLAGAQIILPQKTTRDTALDGGGLAAGARSIEVAGTRLDLAQFPHVGNVDSGKMMVLMFDYTCSSCRRVHGYLTRAEQRFNREDFAIVMLPTPLNPDCNRHFEGSAPDHRNACQFASTALALWSIDPEKFHEFDKWMIETGTASYPPEADAAEAKAVELVGREALDRALGDASVEARIEQTCGVWKTVADISKRITMPKIVWITSQGTKMTEGDAGSEFALADLIEQNLGLVRTSQ